MEQLNKGQQGSFRSVRKKGNVQIDVSERTSSPGKADYATVTITDPRSGRVLSKRRVFLLAHAQ